ncbi:MAG TPA: DNA repair exonuclease [Polyangiaceae bacterium]
MRIVHAADLHLDSPLRGLPPYDGAPIAAVREATRRACENLVAFCIESSAAILLVAGDLYDGDWRDFSTGLFFAKEMSRLREGGVRVVVVRGNHDAASQITRSLRLPDNVRELSAKKAETVLFEELGVAVHGRSFAERAVTEDLSRDYPRPVDGAFNVGLLHTCAEGRPGHEPYAPCKVAELAARGYDYWALGHVHQREVLSREPWIVFPGNLQGRHVREIGPKGATAIDVAGGVIESVEHVALDVVRWAECSVDVGASASVTDVLDAARAEMAAELERADGRVLAARLVVRGPSAAIARVAAARESVTAELRAIANDLRDVYFEKLRVATTFSSATDRGGAGEWVDTLATLDAASDEELLAMAEGALADFRAKLPIEITSGEGALALGDPASLRALLREAQQALLARARAASEEG